MFGQKPAPKLDTKSLTARSAPSAESAAKVHREPWRQAQWRIDTLATIWSPKTGESWK